MGFSLLGRKYNHKVAKRSIHPGSRKAAKPRLKFAAPPLAEQLELRRLLSATYSAILLDAQGDASSGALNAAGGMVVGWGSADPNDPNLFNSTTSQTHALLWSGTSNPIDLNPAGFTASQANGIWQSQEIGTGQATINFGSYTAQYARALLWSGTAASAVDLTPAGFSSSYAFGIFNNAVVGRGSGGSTNGAMHALLWPDASASSAIDLNPPGYSDSQAIAIYSNQEVGYGTDGSGTGNALLWTGSSPNATDLTPAGYSGSNAFGIWNGQVAGEAYDSAASGNGHAIVWSGSASKFADLNPAGATSSRAVAVANDLEVGYATMSATGAYHAFAWTGSAASAVDLQALLPPGYTQSLAEGMDASGDITGIAIDSAGVQHAVIWRIPPSASIRVDNTAVNGPAGTLTSFDASASAAADGTQLSYTWNYGDGTPAVTTTTPTTTHSYTAPGTYTASLTVTDAYGLTSAPATATFIGLASPTLTSAGTAGGATTITGALHLAPNSEYDLRFYSNTSKEQAGTGNHDISRGHLVVTTDAMGNAPFSFTPSVGVPAGEFVTAIATDEFTSQTSQAATPIIVTDASPSYSVGNVPPVVYSDGQPVEFFVTPPTGATGPVMMRTSEQPQGPIDLDPITGKFTYTPAAGDKLDFTVTFQVPGATAGANPITQPVKISPVTLPPEYDVMQETPQSLPDDASNDYVTVTSKDDGTSLFNTQTQDTQDVTVSGVTINLAPGAKFGSQDFQLDWDGVSPTNTNIRNLTIYAQKVVVSGEFRLPGTNVTIYAQELDFEDTNPAAPASIDTSGVSWSPNDPAGAAGSPDPNGVPYPVGQNGLPGQDGGNIALHVEQVQVPTESTAKRLISEGGQGQGAGAGEHGNPGPKLLTYDTLPGAVAAGLHGIVAWFYEDPNPGANDKPLYGQQLWPGDGLPAIPGGVPGDGGSGGTITNSSGTNLPSIADVSGGPPGQPAGHVDGGDPGTPQNAIWVNERYFSGPLDVIASHVSEHGPGWSGATGRSGATGSVNTTPEDISSTSDWLQPAALDAMVAYSKDVYLAGDITSAGKQFSEYQQLLDVMPADAAQQFATLRPEIAQYSAQAAMNLDFFGKPAGWVPALSLAANYDAYQNEIENDLSIEYLSQIILDTSTTQQNLQLAVTNSITQLGTEINLAKAQYADAENLIGPLNNNLANIEADTALVQTELASKQQQLQNEAQSIVADRHSTSFWQEALGVLSGVATALTPAWPGFGVIGAGLGLLDSAISSPSPGNPGGLAGLAGAFKSSTFTDGVAALNNLINSSGGSTSGSGSGSSSANSSSDYVKALTDAGKGLGTALSAIALANQQSQAPASEVDAELKSLEAQDPTFTSLVTQIEQLNGEKAAFQQALAQAMQSISAATSRITSDYVTADALQNQLSSSAAALSIDVVQQIEQMQQQASDRLLTYQYYMNKAYEYQMLTPYSYQWNLGSLDKDIYNLIHDPLNPKGPSDFNDQSDASGVIQTLEAPYRADLQTMASTLDNVLNSEHPNQPQTEDIHLTSGQLAQLNSDRQITINLVDSGFIPASDNATILQMGVAQISATPVGSPTNANVEIEFDHSGTSLMEWQGHRYVFRNNIASEPISWSTDFDATNGFQGAPPSNPVDPASLGDAAIVMGLNVGSLSSQDQSQIVWSNPGAWGDITVKLLSLQSPPVKVNINSATLQVEWVANELHQDSDSLLSVQPTGDLAPKILVTDPTTGASLTDDSGRSDGVGSFARAFSAIGQKVALTAQPTYGSLAFTGWQDANGNLLSTSTTYTASLSGGVQIVRPVYSDLTPQSVAAVANSDGGIDLSWTASQGATSYNVYRSTTPGGEDSPAFATAVSGTSFHDANVTPGTTYYYTVTAASGGAESLSSAEASATPVLPISSPTVASIVVNDGSVQRSEVRSLTVTFSEPVNLAASAFTLALLNNGGSGLNNGSAPTDESSGLSWSSSDGGKTWVITFTANTDATGSLKDGIYRLSITAAGITDALTGTQTLAGGDSSLSFHRLFGDADGNGTVNNADYLRFKKTYGAAAGAPLYNPAFDVDHNGVINNLDYLKLKANYGKAFSY